MSEKPIIFSGPMVRAILAGTKTQTRRVVKVAAKNLVFDLVKAWKDGPQPFNAGEYLHVPFRHKDEDWSHGKSERVFCPYGQPGDRLWVKETFQPLWKTEEPGDYKTGEGYKINYVATGGRVEWCDEVTTDGEITDKVTPSIHMPRWASRLTLEITAVRVERLQEISVGDAMAEGVLPQDCPLLHAGGRGGQGFSCDYIGGYRALWESIHGAGSWALNPWVWVIEFRRIDL